MKRNLLIAMMFVGTAAFAAAQTGVMGTDVLGAHLNYGRGCAGCHAPHSGAFGNGFTPTGADLPNTGSVALWGEDVTNLLGKTLSFGGGSYSEPLPSSITSSLPDTSGVLMCLSCHDGNYAKGAMMKGVVYESLPSSYYNNGTTIPTYLGADGTVAAGSSNYLNDHPVGPSAAFSCNTPPTGSTFGGESGYNWDCGAPTITSSNGRYTVKITPGPNMATFIANYGFFVSLATSGTNAYVTCTTCHNQHVMNVINVGASTSVTPGTAFSGVQTGLAPGQYATMFFLRGPYNPRDANSNSAAQFCRQCHGGESNEMNGISGVATID